MKDTIITGVRVRKVYAALHVPFTIASGSHEKLDNVFLEIKLENGVRGYGEGASSAHITGESQSQIYAELEKAAKWIRGKNACDYHLLAEAEYKISCRAALTAFEMAVLDAWSKTLEVPLWKFFGDKANKIKSDITVVVGGEKSEEDFLEKMWRTGFDIFKIKIGTNFDEDIKRVLFINNKFPGARIYLDANCGYKAKTSLKFMKELNKRNVFPAVFEQPALREDFDGLKFLSGKLNVPVCADESASTFEDAFRIIKYGCSAINIKLMKFGLLRSREIFNLAKAKGTKLMIGEMLESPLSSVCAAHFAAGLDGFDFIDLDTPFFLKTNPTQDRGIIRKNGIYEVSGVCSGIGVEPV